MTDQVTPEGGALPSGANASPSPASPPAKGSEAASPPAASDPGDKPKPPKSGEQLRIDELTRRLRESERRHDRLFSAYEEVTRRGSQPAPAQQSPSQPKTLKDFNYDEGAYTAYRDEQATTRAAQAARDEAAKIRQEDEVKGRRAKYDQRAAKFAETTEDFDAVIRGDWDCSQAMAEVIEESEEGPAVAYYLAQHPDVASQLARLPATKAARELTRIEDRLVADRKQAAARASQAPPPPPKLEGADPGNVERDPTKMSQKQFNKWREGHLR